MSNPLVEKLNEQVKSLCQCCQDRLCDIARHESAVRLWRDEFWPGTRLDTVRERLREAFVGMDLRQGTPYFRLHGRPVIKSPVEHLPVAQLTGSLADTLIWLEFRKSQRDKRQVAEAAAMRRGIISRERDWRRLPLAIRTAAAAIIEEQEHATG